MEHNFIKYLYGYMFRPHWFIVMLAFRTCCGSEVSFLTDIFTITVCLQYIQLSVIKHLQPSSYVAYHQV